MTQIQFPGVSKPRPHVFQTMDGREWEGDVPAGEDAENISCKMSKDIGVPVRCYPKIYETSSGSNQGEIIV